MWLGPPVIHSRMTDLRFEIAEEPAADADRRSISFGRLKPPSPARLALSQLRRVWR